MTVAPAHFGPITAENDPARNRGVLVGECWEDRLECRQWGAHLPHVAGIAGQSNYGAQSVALSGGYEDDEDHGEWFLYTGRFVFRGLYILLICYLIISFHLLIEESGFDDCLVQFMLMLCYHSILYSRIVSYRVST